MAYDWEYDKTISPPAKIVIAYEKTAGNVVVRKFATLISTQYTETYSTWETIQYKDADGQAVDQDVLIKRLAVSRNTQAAVCPNYVQWRLENDLGLPSGDANRHSLTEYVYRIGTDGASVYKELKTEYFTEAELMGRLSVSDYWIDAEAGIPYEPSTAVDLILQQTETTYEKSESNENGRTHTQTKVTNWSALGTTQEGSQSAREQLKYASGSDLGAIIAAMAELVCDGTEVRSSIGRIPVQSKPNEQEQEADELLDQSDPETMGSVGNGVLYDTANVPRNNLGGGSIDPDLDLDTEEPEGELLPAPSAKGQVTFNTSDGDSFTKNTTAEYTMPFAPDDYKSGGDVVPGKSPAAARDYGRMMNMLKAGNAFGCNITTLANRVPSEPFAPVYLNAGGISAGMRLNGTSWAFDQNGLLCSSDLLLCGVAGRVEPVTSSWVRVPVPATSLPILEP